MLVTKIIFVSDLSRPWQQLNALINWESVITQRIWAENLYFKKIVFPKWSSKGLQDEETWVQSGSSIYK